MNPNPISPKVTVAAVAAAAVTILVWILADFFGVTVPDLVQGAFTVLALFGAGYFKRDPLREDYVVDHYEPRHDA